MSFMYNDCFFREKVQIAKSNAALQSISPQLSNIREILIILKSQKMSVSDITDFLQKEDLHFTTGQVRYYLSKNPITRYELSSFQN